jgi:hypothetical protein
MLKRALSFCATLSPVLWLSGATIVYLTVPVLIFCWTWLKLPWAVLSTIGVGIGSWHSLCGLGGDVKLERAVTDWAKLVTPQGCWLLLAGCLLLAAISGAGGYGYQHGDWVKHEVVLKDLVEYAWPVYYDNYGERVGLVYYIAYYLPSALVGKVGGFALANQALFLWTLAGLILSVLWFAICTQRSPQIGLAFFVFVSGLSIVGVILRFYVGLWMFAPAPDFAAAMGEIHISTWAPVWRYTPTVMALFFVPQHALPDWLLTGMIVFVLMTPSSRHSILLLWGISPLWSPFITLGLAPLLCADLLPRPDARFSERVRAYVSLPNALGIALLGLLMIFFATKLVPIAEALNGGQQVRTVFGGTGWDSPIQLFASYALFCVVEFGLFFALDRYHAFRQLPSMKWPYLAVLLWLMVLPTIHYGKYNDLLTRASFPALFFVAILVGRNGFVLRNVSLGRQLLWSLALLLGAVSPLYEIGDQLARILQQRALYHLNVNPDRNLAEQYTLDMSLLQQYVSRVDTLFFKCWPKLGKGRQVTRSPPASSLGRASFCWSGSWTGNRPIPASGWTCSWCFAPSNR